MLHCYPSTLVRNGIKLLWYVTCLYWPLDFTPYTDVYGVSIVFTILELERIVQDFWDNLIEIDKFKKPAFLAVLYWARGF